MIDYLKVDTEDKWELVNNGKRFLQELEQKCITRLPPPKKRAKRAGTGVSKTEERPEWERVLEEGHEQDGGLEVEPGSELGEIDNGFLGGPGLKTGLLEYETQEETRPDRGVGFEPVPEGAERVNWGTITSRAVEQQIEEEGHQPDGGDGFVPWRALNEEGVTETEYIVPDSRETPMDTGDPQPAEIPPDDGEGESDEDRLARIVRNLRESLSGTSGPARMHTDSW